MILVLSQAIFAVLTIVLILLQEPADDRTSYTSFFSPQTVKRGWEKLVFSFTISAIVIFLLLSFLRLIVER